MTHKLKLNRETLRRIDGSVLDLLHAGGMADVPVATVVTCLTCDGNCQTPRTSITRQMTH